MNFDKEITVNIGNYESVKLRISGAENFQQCDYALDAELARLGLKSKAVKP